MRILVISQTYCEWNARAKWRKLAEMYKNLEIRVITPAYWPDVLSKVVSEEEHGERYSAIPTKAYFLGHEIYHFYPSLHKILRDFDPDIIQVETGSNSLALFHVLLIKKLWKLKAKVVFFSWVNWVARFGWKYRYFYEWIEQFSLRNVDGAVLGNSKAVQILSYKKFSKKKSVIPQLGTDPFIFYPARRSEEPEHLVIGFAGRIVPEKGIDTLLDSFVVLKNCKNLSLLVAGEGPYLDNVKKKIVALNLSEQVSLIGALQHEQMPEFFRKLDIFVLPSFDTADWQEQFGQVLVQAMLSKVAIIGSDAGEIPNVIGDAGLVFKQKDSTGLNDCLERVVCDKALREYLALSGYMRAMENYSHEAIAKQTHFFWQELLAQ